ncbi:acetyl-CoA synthetase-like protein [Myriangium duriaei CBS 260.36]|uniref:Acetyl-CoA synthetase-like protein n=1 Tax=Myriangium duriaei CBS 260.36 TaxID=1168546 RepID=A0A9P4ML29_9PEZI|nr:acetyl-CoA synthetase-like protein [Myriangium duriaei CBS 260.36]
MAEPNYFTCTLGQAAALELVDENFTSVPSFIDSQAKKFPNNKAVGFAIPPKHGKEDQAWNYTIYTFKDLHRGSVNLALEYRRKHGDILAGSSSIALLCPSTPEFLFTWLGLMRLGQAVLLIAPQCQAPAIAHLCKACNVTTLVFDEQYKDLADRATVSARDAGDDLSALKISFANHVTISDLLQKDSNQDDQFPKPKASDVAYLHHTSGTSSGVPKPIPQTHRAGCGVLPHFPDGGTKATFTTTPLYHGGIADAFRAWTSGALIWLFPGKGVPITAKNIIRCLHIAKELSDGNKAPPVRYFSSVPYVLQSVEADERGLGMLKDMDIVGVGGAALPTEVGDRLVKSGVNLISRFGSAECGFLMSSHRDYERDQEWQFLRSAQGSQHLQFVDQGDGLAELVISNGWPHMAKQNREDGSFATADLFARHESITDAWRYHSRADSQLTLITGKKFDPAPLEDAIATSELLEDALIFGNGQPYAGVLLFRSERASRIPDQELVGQLWPAIDALNRDSQDHARLLKKMLVPMPVLETELEKSSKGTIIRGAAEKRFADDIDNAYGTADEDSMTDVPDQEVLEALKAHIQSILGHKEKPRDDDDLFAYGVDSVAGMRVRNSLNRLMPNVKKQLPLNIVEDCGTVERLASYVIKTRHGQDTPANEDDEEKQLMLDLVEKYSKFDTGSNDKLTNGHMKHHNNVEEVSDKETVVLTGVTGALGAHLLDLYSQNDRVRRIYCLVRGSDDHACSQRVIKALEQRSLGPLDKSKVVILRSSLGDRHLGLSSADYNRLAIEASAILHVAWAVNFRMRLRSFEKDNIAGVTNLIELALQSSRPLPPRFGFCSSVASVMCSNGSSQDPIPEEISQDTGSATGLGYSRSKWVAEQICDIANRETRLAGRITVFRVGQLAGDSHRGVWNSKEAWPMMLSAVKVTGQLPDLEGETLDWLPVDVAAEALGQGMDPLGGDNGGYCSGQGDDHNQHGHPKKATDVMHVVHAGPNPKWHQLLLWLQAEVNFEIIGPSEWVASLERAATDGKIAHHPAFKLLELWKSAYGSGATQDMDNGKLRQGANSGDGGGGRNDDEHSRAFGMDKTKEAIPALREIKPVDREYIMKLWRWIDTNM